MSLQTTLLTEPELPSHQDVTHCQAVEQFPAGHKDVVGQHHSMATAAEENTVWIGFMYIVPVIGTVKEAVELVLAVYEGNEAVVKEKENAIESILKEPLEKPMKAKDVKKWTPDEPAAAAADISEKENVTEIKHTEHMVKGSAQQKETQGWKLKRVEDIETLPDEPAAAATAFSEREKVIEIRKQIIQHLAKGYKGETKPSKTSAQQKEQEWRLKRVEDIQKEMLEKIHIVKPKFSWVLKEELKRSKRGEHVFNNDILKFHFKVLTEFIQIKKIYMLRGYNEEEIMDKLGKLTLPKKTAEEIQTNMVVHFEDDEFYVNANAVVYGVYCSVLQDALLDVLGHINPDDVTEEKSQWVNFVIDNMNKHQIYVDQLAKDKWINTQARQARFEGVGQEVANMYKTDRGLDWCRNILEAVAPLFGP